MLQPYQPGWYNWLQILVSHVSFATPVPTALLINIFILDANSQCTEVNKGVIIEILNFDLVPFLEGFGFLTNEKRKIFGFFTLKRKF